MKINSHPLLILFAGFLLLLKGTPMIYAGTENASLVGRFEMEMAPTGYWVIDRQADGRFVKKQLLAIDMNQPSEIVIVWGRWRLVGKNYTEIIEGTNSPFLAKSIGKPSVLHLSSVTSFGLCYIPSDYHAPRCEKRVSTGVPLLKLPLRGPSPDDGMSGANRKVITRPVGPVPAWVSGSEHL